MRFVLAVDAGTTNIRAGLVDARGRVRSVAGKPMRVIRDAAGRAEHHPEELFRNMAEVCRRAVRGRGREVGALVLSAYQLGLMAVDRRMRPLAGMATILDTRPRETFGELLRRADVRRLYRLTGCPPFASYALPRIHWMRRRLPALFRRASLFLGSKDWLLWRLTGVVAAEMSTAAATQLLDFRRGRWDAYALGIAGLRERMLPPLVWGDRPLARLRASAADALGLSGDTLVVPGVYDGGALALGLGALGRGAAAVNLGTSAMLRVAVGRPVLDRSGEMRLSTWAFLPGLWLSGAGVNNAGGAVDWFMRAFGVRNHAALERLVRSARGGESAPVFYPFLTGERDPRIGSGAAGMVAGLREHHRLPDLARALLEGVVFTLRMVADSLRGSGAGFREARVGGGGTRLRAWMAMLAEGLGSPLRIAGQSNPSLAGSAMLGFAALGEYGDLREAAGEMAFRGKPIRPRKGGKSGMEGGYRRFIGGLKAPGGFPA